MKKTVLGSVVLILLGFYQPQKRNEDIFKRLYQLEGTWIMQTNRGIIGEEWIKLNDDLLRSKGFFVKGKDTIVTEKVTLTNSAEGIFYTSAVENQNNKQPVPFKLTSTNNNAFVFENHAHDYPKRIVYEFAGKDSIHAYIDAGVDDKKSRQHFYYHKQHK